MKKITLTLLLACCSMMMAAQTIKVNYKGAKPTISDFAWSYLQSCADDDEEDCCSESSNALRQAWTAHRKGAKLSKGETLTIDEKNGYAVYESRYEEHLLKIEMCYWNESDQKHKLFAYNVVSFRNGKHEPGQFDGLMFYRYDNATKKMTPCDNPGFTPRWITDNGTAVSYSLPRTGKDIIETAWHEKGKKQKTLKWNGRKFSY